MGFAKSKLEPCVYYKTEGKDIVILTIYVDDFLLLFGNAEEGKSIKKELSSEWDLKDLGVISNYFGS